MGIEIPLWSCFVLIARVYSPFVLFLFQNFLTLLYQRQVFISWRVLRHYHLPRSKHRPALLARVVGTTAN